jgi:ribonucleoside-diphosphate reductase alpha chain
MDGKEVLSEIIIHNKYARYIPELKRRENWEEIVSRNEQMHLEKFPEIYSYIREAYDEVRAKNILPSMRSLQFAGRAIERNNSRIYNCSYIPITDAYSFSEIIFLLLGGTGVGYSVQKRHIDQLPTITIPKKTKRFLIADSLEGWSDSIFALMKAYFNGGRKPIFDYSDIREKGVRLVTAGGKAPGPGPLKNTIEKIDSIFATKKHGDRLSDIEVHDIVCHIADAVLAGGK